MVQLHYGPKSGSGRSPPGVRRVTYSRLEDIPWLLNTDGSAAVSVDLRTEAVPFNPAAAPEDVPEPEEEEPPAADDGEAYDSAEQAVDVENVAQAIDSEYAPAAPTAPTPEEITAATTIAEAYRRYTADKRVKRKSSEEARRRDFASFIAEAGKMDWPHRYYRMLFQGPIAHLYIVVGSMKNHLHEARSRAKQRFNVVQHLELESVQSSLTQLK